MNRHVAVCRLVSIICASAILSLMPGSLVRAANILWVSDLFTENAFSPPGTGVTDTNFITLLQNAGHNVQRFNGPNSAATALTGEQITAINTNDLIIVGRAVASGAFTGVQGGQWNMAVTRPLMIMSSYLVRRDSLGWFVDQGVPDVAGTTLTGIDLGDPEVAYMFQNAPVSAGTTTEAFDEPMDRNLSTMSAAPVPGGVVLARATVNNAVIIAEFPAGTPVKAGAEPLGGYRMLFCGGSREAASPGGVANAGKDNLTPMGETMFLYAVEIAANSGLVPSDPTPVSITSQIADTTVAEASPATFTVGVAGSPRSFHWSRNGIPIPGANRDTYTVPSTTYPGDNGAQFQVIVSNSLNMVTSEIATLTVLPDTNGPTVVSAIGELDPTQVTVTFSEPLDLNTVSEGTFSIYETGTNPDDGLLTAGFSLIDDNRTAMVTTEPRSPGVNYSIRVTGVLDRSSQQNLLSPDPTLLPLPQRIQLIGFDSNNEWKYDINNGDRFGTGWETVGYDDIAWPIGAAGLGLDSSANGVVIRTPLPYQADSAPVFFRRHFVLPSATNGVSLRLRHVIEDGAVYYLNGQEAARFRVNPGTLTFTSRASGTAPDPTPIEGPFDLPAANLLPGDNVLAVAVLQSGATSSDIELAVELTAIIPMLSDGPPEILVAPQSQTVSEGQTVSFSVVAEGFQPLSFQWRKDGADIPGANASSYIIPSAIPNDNGAYDAVVSNSVGSVTSAVATLTVQCDCVPPAFLSAVGQTNLNEIRLTFSEWLNIDSVEDVGNYTIGGLGVGDLIINSATLINGTNILLNTSPRAPGAAYTVQLGPITDRSVCCQNVVIPQSRSLRVTTVLLAPNDSTLWRFNVGSNNLDGLGWQLPAYDDSAWPTELAGFTTSNNLEVTTNGFQLRSTNMLAPSSGGPLTAYYRVNFTLLPDTSGTALRLVGVVDDGLVAYVNGVEAGRLRVTNASPVSFTNLATAASPETSNVHLPLETIVFTNLAGLVPGENLLAIELHQNSATSSDAVLSVQLLAETESIHVDLFPRLIISINPATGEITLGRTVSDGVLQQATELLSPGTEWTDVPGNPNPYVFTPGDEKRFFLLRR